MRKIFFITILLFIQFSFSQSINDYKNYIELDRSVTELYKTNQTKAAIKLMEAARKKFPENNRQILQNLIFLYKADKQYKKAIDVYSQAQKLGVMFTFRPNDDNHLELLKYDAYKKFVRENDRIIMEANKNSKPNFYLVIPETYDSTKTYGLLIVLHSQNSNNDVTSRFWHLGEHKNDYLIAFLQSSQLTATNSFGWDDPKKSEQDIKSIYNYMNRKYKINNEKVIIAGFSRGAKVAIDAFFNETIPANSFIALSPVGTASTNISFKQIEKAINMKKSGVIITGSEDYSFILQNNVAKTLKEYKFNINFEVIEKLDHKYPPNLKQYLDKAIDFINKK